MAARVARTRKTDRALRLSMADVAARRRELSHEECRKVLEQGATAEQLERARLWNWRHRMHAREVKQIDAGARRQQADIVEVVKRYVDLRRAGSSGGAVPIP